MDWTDFEELIRSSVDDELEEVGDYSNVTWSLNDLVRFTNLALANFSRHFPLEKSHEVTVVAGTRGYDLPADIITPPHRAIVDARWQRSPLSADHLVITRWRQGAVETISPRGSNKGAYIWGSKLYLEKEPVAADATYPIELLYHAIHTAVPDDPEEFSFTVSDSDIECIFWYTTALMMMKLDAGDATLRQYADDEELGSSRDDSPPRSSAKYRMQQYRDCIRARLEHKDTPKLRRVRR